VKWIALTGPPSRKFRAAYQVIDAGEHLIEAGIYVVYVDANWNAVFARMRAARATAGVS
jgi:hypothetical protein